MTHILRFIHRYSGLKKFGRRFGYLQQESPAQVPAGRHLFAPVLQKCYSSAARIRSVDAARRAGFNRCQRGSRQKQKDALPPTASGSMAGVWYSQTRYPAQHEQHNRGSETCADQNGIGCLLQHQPDHRRFTAGNQARCRMLNSCRRSGPSMQGRRTRQTAPAIMRTRRKRQAPSPLKAVGGDRR